MQLHGWLQQEDVGSAPAAAAAAAAAPVCSNASCLGSKGLTSNLSSSYFVVDDGGVVIGR